MGSQHLNHYTNPPRLSELFGSNSHNLGTLPLPSPLLAAKPARLRLKLFIPFSHMEKLACDSFRHPTQDNIFSILYVCVFWAHEAEISIATAQRAIIILFKVGRVYRGVKLFIGSKDQCIFSFEIGTPEGRGREMGGNSNFKTKYRVRHQVTKIGNSSYPSRQQGS